MNTSLRALLAASILLLATPAFADVIDPNEDACSGKAKGDACDLNGGQGGGACQDGECCRLDYSNGTPPKTVCEPCLLCNAAPIITTTPPPEQPAEPTPEKKQPEESSSCAAAGPGATSMLSLLAGAFMLTNMRRRRRA
jgi:hypothetical protein